MAGRSRTDRVELDTHVRGDEVIHERYEQSLSGDGTQVFAATDSHLLSVKWEEGTDTERTRRIPLDEIDSVEPRPRERSDGAFASFLTGFVVAMVGLGALYVGAEAAPLATSVAGFAVGWALLLAGGYLLLRAWRYEPAGYAVELDVPEGRESLALPADADELAVELRDRIEG